MLRLGNGFLLVWAFLFMVSCDRDNQLVEDFIVTTDNNSSDFVFDDVYNNVSFEAQQSNTLRSCGTVTLDTTVFPITATVDFGTGCTGIDGRQRSGKLIATFSGRWLDSGTVVTVVPEDYVVSGYKVKQGTLEVKNEGVVNGVPTYSRSLINGVIETPNGNTLLREASHTIRWTAGNTTVLNRLDDVIEVTGGASGTSSNGVTYTTVITVPLEKARSCYWVRKGVIELTPSGVAARRVDFGNGTCDATVTISTDKITRTITLL